MLANLSKEEDMEFLQTLIEEQHFPFYEFLWLCMLGLWWSVINRLNRITSRPEIVGKSGDWNMVRLTDCLVDLKNNRGPQDALSNARTLATRRKHPKWPDTYKTKPRIA